MQKTTMQSETSSLRESGFSLSAQKPGPVSYILLSDKFHEGLRTNNVPVLRGEHIQEDGTKAHVGPFDLQLMIL
jgi:hypothetical protein